MAPSRYRRKTAHTSAGCCGAGWGIPSPCVTGQGMDYEGVILATGPAVTVRITGQAPLCHGTHGGCDPVCRAFQGRAV